MGLTVKKVVQYEKAADRLEAAKAASDADAGLKRNDLIPDSITYGVENEPVLTYGTVKVPWVPWNF